MTKHAPTATVTAGGESIAVTGTAALIVTLATAYAAEIGAVGDGSVTFFLSASGKVRLELRLVLPRLTPAGDKSVARCAVTHVEARTAPGRVHDTHEGGP